MKDWLYSTWLGGLYLEYLIWYDSRFGNTTRFLTPREMAQIVKETHKIEQGTIALKTSINNLVTSKSKEGYQVALKQLDDLLVMAKYDDNTGEAQLANIARQIYVKKGNKDIVTALDRAKMIENRIQDVYALQDHKARRDLMRTIRRLRVEGKLEEADKLQQEWYNKYGKRVLNGPTKS